MKMKTIAAIIIPMLILLFGFSCTPSSNSTADAQQVAIEKEISTRLMEIFKWYENQPKETFLGTVWGSDEIPIMKQKTAFIDWLAQSGFFTEGFIRTIDKYLTRCEEEGKLATDFDRFECLDEDFLTYDSFGEYESVDSLKVEQSGDRISVTFQLAGYNNISPSTKIKKRQQLNFQLRKVGSNWRIHQTHELFFFKSWGIQWED